MKKSLLLLICLNFIATKIISQKCNAPYQPGEYLVGESKAADLCFLREPEIKNDGIKFHTRYTFNADAGREHYILDFYFDKASSQISVSYNDKNSKFKTDSIIPVDTLGSLFIFKNYMQNDTTITKDDGDATIVFSIYNIEEPFITLNQFKLLNLGALFKLVDIEDDQLEKHISKVQSLRSSIKNEIIDRAGENKIDVFALKKEIEDYRDFVFAQLDNDDKTAIDEIWPKEASNQLAKEFTDKLNTFIYPYYKNVFPYQEHDSRIEFNFICNAEGKINNVKDIHSVNSLQIKWIEDSFKLHIMPRIQKEVFGNMAIQRRNLNLISDFNSRFSGRIDMLERRDSAVDDILVLQKEIRDGLVKKMERSKNIPTRYTYILSYKSSTKYEVWKYAPPNNKRGEILGPDGSTEQISDVLKSKFRNGGIIQEKKSKYNIERCDVFINNETKAEDLRQRSIISLKN